MMRGSLNNLLSFDFHQLALAISTHTQDLGVILIPSKVIHWCWMDKTSFHFIILKDFSLTCGNENSRVIFFSVEKYRGRVVSLFEIIYLGMILSGLFINISNEYLSELRATCKHSLWPYTLLLADLNVETRTLDNEPLVEILVDHGLWSGVRNRHWIWYLCFFIFCISCFLANDMRDIYNRWDMKLYYNLVIYHQDLPQGSVCCY